MKGYVETILMGHSPTKAAFQLQHSRMFNSTAQMASKDWAAAAIPSYLKKDSTKKRHAESFPTCSIADEDS